MAANSNISWTDHTFNPWIGCTKVSEGCAHCYAETQDKNRFSRTLGGGTPEKPILHWGKGAPRYRTAAANWLAPARWNKAAPDYGECERCGPKLDSTQEGRCPNCTRVDIWHSRRPRVFCSSLADWLDDEVPIEWLADLLALIYATPNLDWLLLTKRPENFFIRQEAAWKWSPGQPGKSQSFLDWLRGWGMDGQAPANVWLGTTVENQARADERIPKLLEIPAKVRFLSCEPLLGAVDLWGTGATSPQLGVHWVIAGGESGPCHRVCDVEWITSLADQCAATGVAFFCKQDSGPKSGAQGRIPAALWNRKEFPR